MALPREKQASALCRPSMAMETPGQEGLNPDEPARTEPGRLKRSSSLCLPAAHRSCHRRRPPPSPCAPSPSPLFLSSPRSREPANPSVRSWAARRRPPSSRPFGKDAVLVDAVCGGRRRAGGGGGMKVHAMGHRQTEAGGGGAAGAALDCEVRRRSRGRGGWR